MGTVDSTIDQEVGSQLEPDTQPINSQEIELLRINADEDNESAWGWLYPTNNFKLKTVELTKDTYTFGRSVESDIRIKEEHVDRDVFAVISKIQFRVFKQILPPQIEVIRLEDTSMNGTFVNSSKVGKGKTIVLNSGDEIALTCPYFSAYRFVKRKIENKWIPPELEHLYLVISPLGEGAFGEVQLAHCKKTEKLVAIKKIKKVEENNRRIFNEVMILQKMKHPCIVSMEQVFDMSESIFIVLEYVRGGELAKRLNEVVKLSNTEAKSVFYQLVLALQYLHCQGIAHRDLKPENILLCGKTGDSLVKVSDFGLSKLVNPETHLKSFCGTPSYTAPEILVTQGTGSYTHKVDIWSLGVVMFRCVSGKLPFRRDRHGPVIEQIVRGSYSMSGPEWIGVTNHTRSVIRRMLRLDPGTRITINEILNHPWLKDNDMLLNVKRLMRSSLCSTDENLNEEVRRPPLKKLRLNDDEDTVFRS